MKKYILVLGSEAYSFDTKQDAIDHVEEYHTDYDVMTKDELIESIIYEEVEGE